MAGTSLDDFLAELDALDVGGDGDTSGLTDARPPVGGRPPGVAEFALALDALALPEERPRQPQRGPIAAARMRVAKAQKRVREQEAALKKLKLDHADEIARVAAISPSIVKAAGLQVARIGQQDIGDTRALTVVRLALLCSASLVRERRHSLAHRMEHTVMQVLLQRQRLAPGLLLECAQRLTAAGRRVFVGFALEWDEAKTTFKSLGNIVAADARKRTTIEEIVKTATSQGGRGLFHQSQSETMLNFSGNVRIVVVGPEGERWTTEMHWVHPPLALLGDSSKTLAAALSQAPISLFDMDYVSELSKVADAVVAISCADRAGANLACVGQMRQRVADGPANVLSDEEWCNLHSVNNLKIASSALCKLTGRLHAVASLMKVSSYVRNAVVRFAAVVEAKVVRYAALQASESQTRANYELLDSLWDFDSEHHRRTSATGTVTESTFLMDLRALLRLDNGNLRDTSQIVHYCLCPDGTSCCNSLEETKDKMFAMYVRVYLGSAWPVPAVSRFTHTSMILKKLSLAFAHHGLITALVEPTDAEKGEALPELLAPGSSLSEFQAAHRVRKNEVFNWVVAPGTRWEMPIMLVLTAPLDELIYVWFRRKDRRLSMHDVVCGGGVLGKRGFQLLRLLSTWVEDGAPESQVVTGVVADRSVADEHVRKFIRSNLLIFAAGFHRRDELAFSEGPAKLHRALCEDCTPTEAARAAVWADLRALRTCCQGFFVQRVIEMFPAEDAWNDLRAKVLVELREDLLKFSTKLSEASHARVQRLLGSQRKRDSVGTLARKSFLAAFRDAHARHGGNLKWGTMLHGALLDAARAEQDAMREHHHIDLGQAPAVGPLADAADAAEGTVAERAKLPADEAPKKGNVRNRGGLNPVLVAMNNAVSVAARLSDSPLTPKQMEEIRRGVKENYAAGGDRADQFRRDFKLYQQRQIQGRPAERNDADEGAELRSSFWGWGSRSIPMPVEPVRAYIAESGLASVQEASGEDASRRFCVAGQSILVNFAVLVCDLFSQVGFSG